jgi:hypothetical protein
MTIDLLFSPERLARFAGDFRPARPHILPFALAHCGEPASQAAALSPDPGQRANVSKQ